MATRIFRFPITQKLMELASHSLENKDYQVEPDTQVSVKEPSLLLIKGSGVYLLSPQTLTGHKDKRLYKRGKLAVEYAEFHPSGSRLEGESFAFNLPIPELLKKHVARVGRDVLEIEMVINADDTYSFTTKLYTL